jgi:cytochrome b pre-mRNA-processing protein 3
MQLWQKLKNTFAGPADDVVAGALYAAIIRQARLPAFYRDMAVPDSVDGRFEMLALHTALVMLRLKQGADAAAHECAQRLFDLMAADLDRNLREMGVGDMGVGKKMRVMGEAFFGRMQAYQTALVGDEIALQAALDRNLYGTVNTNMAAVVMLAAYVRKQCQHLASWPLTDMLAGRIEFLSP